MFDNINRQLIEISQKIRDKNKTKSRLSRAQEQYYREYNRLEALKIQLQKEGRDVEKLEGLSLTGLFYTVLGTKLEHIDKEKQEYLSAKLRYDECSAAVAALDKEMNDLKRQMGEFSSLEKQYDSLLKQKQEMISKMDNQYSRQLAALDEELIKAQAELKELNEASSAGRSAVEGINQVIKSLESAQNWGTWDMLGGGLISTAVKHSKIDEAKEKAHWVQQLLRSFERELSDVGDTQQLDIDMGSFATFADYFFDGLISDWIVQSRINSSKESALKMYRYIDGIVSRLQARIQETNKHIDHIEYERRELVINQ